MYNSMPYCYWCSQVAQAETEYEQQLNDEKRRIQQAAHENLSLKDRKLRLLKNIMNQSDVESLAGELAQTPSSQQTHYQVKPAHYLSQPRLPAFLPSTFYHSPCHCYNRACTMTYEKLDNSSQQTDNDGHYCYICCALCLYSRMV